jgi:hypothetical protein
MDSSGPVNRTNVTGADGLDTPDRTLKVATRVRIPLGLQRMSRSEDMRHFRVVHIVHPVVRRAVE